MPLSTPVAFIIFRRPEVTAKVFEQIRLAQPKQLFVIADGPRNEEEALPCQQARAITEQIDWDCEVYRDYSEANLGCRRRVSSGLNWVFEQVEEAIVLEDDCLPSPSFFTFCQELLDYYRNDTRIWMISGDNFQDGKIRGDGSYYFSRYPHCWGWATWKRAWKNYQDDLAFWPKLRDSGLMDTIFEDPVEIRYWTKVFNKLTQEGKPDSWAYRWAYSCWSNSALITLPNVNLVSNLGFGDAASNTIEIDANKANLPAGEISPIQHPPFVVRDSEADFYTSKNLFRDLPFRSSFLNKAQGKIKTEVRKISSLWKK
ncbi:hypothetical protein GFS31_27680 [Leptolyngbya sp. BL0902]|uniref:glycosyltransferase family 2 protein n=1 Tax=Leptolyngbya sp. BL0902 TaxID=1115757 RepID=UPI0018E7A149|nr:glycosyltransferase family 2 protein [Leptolyngbya sp. BL0902]QQE66072.1 hypothetical protein GFS31_27680 [Leptolyngbya sp. BL0902]